jgi:hypothetical protein
VKLYDFSVYAERRNAIRKEEAAVRAVAEVMIHIEQPGSVTELKYKVDDWFTLHRKVATRN